MAILPPVEWHVRDYRQTTRDSSHSPATLHPNPLNQVVARAPSERCVTDLVLPQSISSSVECFEAEWWAHVERSDRPGRRIDSRIKAVFASLDQSPVLGDVVSGDVVLKGA
jgi:hypothetical protein